MRNYNEVNKELERFIDRSFYEYHKFLKENGTIDEFLKSEYEYNVTGAKNILKFNAELKEKYKNDSLFQKDCNSFEWGVISGKLAALRWVMGEEWNKIDPYIKERL